MGPSARHLVNGASLRVPRLNAPASAGGNDLKPLRISVRKKKNFILLYFICIKCLFFSPGAVKPAGGTCERITRPDEGEASERYGSLAGELVLSTQTSACVRACAFPPRSRFGKLAHWSGFLQGSCISVNAGGGGGGVAVAALGQLAI